MKDDKESKPSEFPHTGLQPGIDQTDAGTGKEDKFYHEKRSATPLGSGISKDVGAPGRAQLFPQDPAVHSGDSNLPGKAPIAVPHAYGGERKPQDVIAPSPHTAATNLTGVSHPKDAGYAPLHESAGPISATASMGTYASKGKGIPDTKPAVADIGLTPAAPKTRTDASKVGGTTEQSEPLLHKAQENKASHGIGMGLPNSVQNTLGEGGKLGGTTDTKKDTFGAKAMASSKDHSQTSSKKSDYTAVLDKIADDSPDSGTSKGVAATAAEYVSSGAKTVANKAQEIQESVAGKGSTADASVADSAKATAQGAADKARAAGQTITDTAAQGTKAAQDATKPYVDSAAEKTNAALVSAKEKTGATDDKTAMEKAQAVVQTAAAVTADKANQIYQAVAQKVHETGLPQVAADKTAEARDAAAAKYNELTTEAQRQQAAAQEAAQAALAHGKARAQDAGNYTQQKAAELVQNVRDASTEDVNRSTLGRTAGGILLVALASYALGVPFRYGLATALFALAAVLFADWDRSRHSRRSPLMSTSHISTANKPVQRTVEVRRETDVRPTEFGYVKAHAGRLEDGPLGSRFVKEE